MSGPDEEVTSDVSDERIEEICRELDEGSAKDIWYDAHVHGDEKGQHDIETFQGAVSNARRMILDLKTMAQNLADRLGETTVAAEKGAPVPLDAYRALADFRRACAGLEIDLDEEPPSPRAG